MMETQTRQLSVFYALLALAGLTAVAALTTLTGGILLLVTSGIPPPALLKVVALAGFLMIALPACGLTTAAVVFVWQLHRLTQHMISLDHRTAAVAEQNLARPQADTGAAALHADLTEVKRLLRDIRETLLLPPEQRERRFRVIVERESQRHLSAAEAFVASGDFHRARQELALLAERFGPSERISEAEAQLEKASDATRAQNLAAAAAHIEDLMAMGHWAQAEQSARELADQYPKAAEPGKLIERVEHERRLFEEQHRPRMHEEIQQFVSQRRWRDAARSARQFIETFPTGSDTEGLRQQLETLEANADIEVRQQLERHIKEYVQQQKYADAVELARRIINEFPFSPQANALRSQLPRLEELARQHGLPK